MSFIPIGLHLLRQWLKKLRPLFMVPLSTDKEAFFLLSPPEDLVLNKVSGLTQNM
jgi:zinc finger-containing ubiquitin peptidase 1